MDMRSAFLNGELEEEFYMYQPQYFHIFLAKSKAKKEVCEGNQLTIDGPLITGKPGTQSSNDHSLL
jgi:hypothetical protein